MPSTATKKKWGFKDVLRYRSQKLDMLLHLDFETKLMMSKLRIRQALPHESHWLVGFSGGKDSLVLSDLVLHEVGKVPHLWSNTQQQFFKQAQFNREYCKRINVELFEIKPQGKFFDIVAEHGFPMFAKDVAQLIDECQRKDELPKTKKKFGKAVRYLDLIQSKFKISNKCCWFMKERGGEKFQRRNNFRGIFIGNRADESNARRIHWLKYGCNYLDTRGLYTSHPIAFWNDADVYHYLKINNIELPLRYHLGYNRTGCILCGFGAQLINEGMLHNYELLRVWLPKLWYSMMYQREFRKLFEACHVKWGKGLDAKFVAEFRLDKLKHAPEIYKTEIERMIHIAIIQEKTLKEYL